MKKLYILLLLIGILLKAQGQTALENAMKTMDVSMKIPEFLSLSQNERGIYVTEITEESPCPSSGQIYGEEPSYGATAYKVIFGTVHSIMKFNDEDCIIFVYAGGENEVKYGNVNDFFNVVNPVYNRIKSNLIRSNLKVGVKNKSATEEEIETIDKIITHHPKEEAQKLFNADWMATYLMDMKNNAYEDKYTKCKAVVVDKKKLNIFFYFMMTDDSAAKFDEYLNRLQGVFWYNN